MNIFELNHLDGFLSDNSTVFSHYCSKWHCLNPDAPSSFVIQLLPKTKTERGKARTALFLIRTKLNILGHLKIMATFSWGHMSTTWLQFKKYVPSMKDKDIVLPMILRVFGGQWLFCHHSFAKWSDFLKYSIQLPEVPKPLWSSY